MSDQRRFVTGGALRGALFSAAVRQAVSAPELSAGTTLGPWTIVSEIGAGGMARVYRATRRDVPFHQEVALKVVAASAALIEKFQREREILVAFSHHAIVHFIDSGEEDGFLWIAMELVEGKPVDVRLGESAARDWRQRLRLFDEICEALAYAHSRGVIHRDIKPSNVLVDAKWRARLLDFGIATFTDALDPEHSMSLAYASPEQRSGGQVTTLSDVYQLGLLLRTFLQPSAGDWPRHVQANLQRIAAHATAWRPEDRYAGVAQFRADVAAVAEARAFSLRNAAAYRAGLWVKRNPLSAGIGGLAIVLMLGSVLASARHQQRELESAQAAAAQSDLIRGFMTSLFATPLGADTADAERLLDLGSARLAQTPDPDAAIRAQLGLELATAYDWIGNIKKAHATLETFALDAQHTLPEGSIHRARLFSMLGMTLYRLGDFPAVGAWYERVADELLLVEDEPARRIEQGILSYRRALLFNRLGDSVRAEVLARESVRVLEAAAGTEHIQTARALNTLGLALRSRGKFSEARQAFEDSGRIYRTRLGESHKLTLGTASNLALIDGDLGNTEQAARTAQANIAVMRGLFSGPAPELANELNLLTNMRIRQERYDEAQALASEADQIYRDLMGEHGAFRLYTLNNLGRIRTRQGDPRGALHYFEASLAIVRENYGDRHVDIARTLKLVSEAELAAGDTVAAERHSRQALEIFTERAAEHVETGRAALKLASLLADSGRVDEARSYLVEAERILSLGDGATPSDLAGLQVLRSTLDSAQQARRANAVKQ